MKLAPFVLSFDLWTIAYMQRMQTIFRLFQKKITKEQAFEMVNREPWQIKNIPEEVQSHELWLTAVKKTHWHIYDCPEKFQSVELWKTAIEQNPHITKCPEEFQTTDVWVTALSHTYIKAHPEDLIKHIPEKINTINLWKKLAAIKNFWSSYEKYIPKEFHTPELGEAVIAADKEQLRFIPESMQTQKMWDDSIARGMFYSGWPKQFQNESLWRRHLVPYFNNIRYCPKEFQPDDVCIDIINKNDNGFYDNLFLSIKNTEDPVIDAMTAYTVKRDPYVGRFELDSDVYKLVKNKIIVGIPKPKKHLNKIKNYISE